MLALTEKQMLIQALGQVVFDEVQTAVAPFKEKILQLEKVLGDMPVPQNGIDGKDGVNGKDGKDGVSVTIEDVMPQVQDYIQAHVDSLKVWTRDFIDTIPKPEKGEKGDPGKDVDIDMLFADLTRRLDSRLDDAIAAIPIPKDGRDGRDGKDGVDGKDGKDGVDGVDGKSVTLDDLRACIDDLVSKAVASIPIPRNCVGGFIDRAGHLYLSFSDGCNSDLGPVIGRDGKDCDFELVRSQVATFLSTIEKPKDGVDGKDGKDGVGFDDLSLEYDGARLVTFKFVKGDNAKVFNLHFPIPLYQGIWREGESLSADIVQRDGSMWIAKKDTNTVPGSPDSDWQLCTKRGRDGKDGKQGPQGPEGKTGRNGRDLTQLGFDGSKY